MVIWGISFLEIEAQWTDDQFFMFIDRAGDRVKRENGARKNSGDSGGESNRSPGNVDRKSYTLDEFIANDRKAKGLDSGDRT